MRKILLTALIILLSACLAGMAGAAGTKSKIVLVTDQPPRTMDPHGSGTDDNLSYMPNFFDGLMERSGLTGELVPALAEKYERPDTLTWKFYLRKGVKFHNGNPFTAHDVKFSFERLSNPKVSEFINEGKNIDKVEVIDDYTVIIKTKVPTPWFLQSMVILFIMDKESTESRKQADIGLNPIGTGAYKFQKWVKGSYLKMEANPDYWGGPPSIKEVEIKPITEASTRFAAMVTGQADLIYGVPVQLYDKIKNTPTLEVVANPARRSIFLMLTNKKGTPMADIRVRRAMAMAINEDEIITKVMRGLASKASQIPDPPTVGYNSKIKRLEYNPAEAKRLLKEAGFEKGFEIVLAGTNDRYIQDAQICEAVAKYLAKVNIKVKLEVKPKSIFFPAAFKGKFPFYLIGWFDSTYDLGRLYTLALQTFDAEKGHGKFNGTRYSDAKIDKVLAGNISIVDLEKRKKTLQELNRMAMEDQMAVIPLHYQVDVYAKQKAKGIVFKPRPDRYMVMKEFSFKK